MPRTWSNSGEIICFKSCVGNVEFWKEYVIQWGYIINCNYYMNIKLLSLAANGRDKDDKMGVHFWESIWIYTGWSTTKVIRLVRGLVEKYKKRKRNLYMVFIDLENLCDKVSRNVLYRWLEAKSVLMIYIGW